MNKDRADNINKHGINITYFNRRLKAISKNISDYKPAELARYLAKLAHTADRQAAINQMHSLELNNIDD